MPRPVRVFQRQVNKPVVLKLFAAAAVLAVCLLAVTHLLTSDSKQLSAASYADAQISKLDVKSSDSTVDTASEPKAQPKEPTTSDIFHAVDAELVSDSTESNTAKPLDTNEVFRQAELAKEVARQAAVDAEQLLISRQAEPVADVVYFNDAKSMAEIGCPAMNLTEVTDNFTCFYQNPSTGASEFLSSTWEADNVTGCAAVFRPLPADFGRPWCLQKSEVIDTRVGASLEQTTNEKALHLQGSTLLLGMLSGPNPTHQLNIHFYHIFVWMKKHGVEMGDLTIVADCPDPSKCMGPYGIGLARAFGKLHFLPELPPVTVFDEITFSMSVGFPFDIHKYELDKTLDCNFLELTWAVKQHYGIDPEQRANPKRIIIAVRKPNESRALGNVADLHAALQSRGYNASIVTFGKLTFQQQLEAVSDAAVLVGVTGSDLMNLVFLPISGSIVEIFPVAQGQQVFTPELWNLAHMVGKNHLKYVSPYNSTLMLDSEGQVMGDRPVHQTKATEVHVPGLVALIEAAALSAVLENTVWNRMSIERRASGKGIKCWDRTQ
jgi:hypothetical protein